MKRLCFLLWVLSLSLSAYNQREVVRSVHLEINSLQQLDTAPFLVQLPSPTEADFDAGFVQLNNAVELKVYSNIPWRLFIKRDGHWQNITTGHSSQDLSIGWARNNQIRFRNLSNGEQNRVGQGHPVGGRTFQIHLKVPISWETLSHGNWQCPLEFRLVAR